MSSETPAALDLRDVAPVGHDEAMVLAATELSRTLDLARSLAPADWTTATVNTAWDVREVLLHVLGATESHASLREAVHQLRQGRRRFRVRGGTHWVDGIDAVQVEDRAHLAPDEVVDRLAAAAPRSVRARRRLPRLVRALPLADLPQPLGRRPLGYLMDRVYTRDAWMHRVDVARATGRPLVLTPEHDGRLVADMVADWARLHRLDADLELTGPAGGHYVAGRPSRREHLRVDAVELVWVLSGRGEGAGLLAHPFPL